MERRGKHALNYMDLMEPTAISPEDEAKWMKKQVEKSKQRLYVSWRNTKGADCKMIGPQTKCFCNHRFKEHNSMQSSGKSVHCLSKCPCKQFYYIPTHGAYDFKCLCHHSYKQHDPVTKKCKRGKCSGCIGGKFGSTWTCSCGLKFSEHRTVVETFQERKDAGRLVGDLDRMAQELDQVEDKGGLLNPNLDHSPISKSVEVKKETTKTVEQKKKQQLNKLNKMLAAEREPQEIKQEIQQIEGEIPIMNLYTQPHQYRKVSAPLKKITR